MCETLGEMHMSDIIIIALITSVIWWESSLFLPDLTGSQRHKYPG